MNGFLIFSALYGMFGLYEFDISFSAFFHKKPNISLGIGALVSALVSCYLGIWVSTFEGWIGVLFAVAITIIVMAIACVIRSASKELIS